jgi:hypothetical protein
MIELKLMLVLSYNGRCCSFSHRVKKQLGYTATGWKRLGYQLSSQCCCVKVRTISLFENSEMEIDVDVIITIDPSRERELPNVALDKMKNIFHLSTTTS